MRKRHQIASVVHIASPALVLLAVALGGCAAQSDIALFQPQMRGLQRELHLATEQAWWSGDAHVERMVAEFPLPGATTGRPTYLLYLRLPSADAQDSAEGQSRGFFVQTRGQYAGLAKLSEVQVETRKATKTNRQYIVELTCEDGTRLTGQILARRNDSYLKTFETERRPGDIQALIAGNQPK